MPDKIQNKPVSWRDHLENLDQVNGLAPLNKGEAWQTLNNKLEQPGKKSNKTWVWLAVAAIATGLVLIFPFFYNGEYGQDQPIAHQPQAPKTNSISESGPVSAPGNTRENQPVSALTGISRTKQQTSHSKTNHLGISQIAVETLDEKEFHPAISPVSTIQQTDITIEKSMDSPMISAFPATGRKKKLPVVYLNEIEDNNNQLLTDKQTPKKFRKLNQKFDLSEGNDVFATSREERFSISISSAN